jgi:putative Ig domain-containing protein
MAYVLLVLLMVCASWTQQETTQKPAGTVPLAIVTDSLPQPIAHTPYTVQVTAQGGMPPYSWSIEKGKLPQGLHLDPRTGTLSGAPEAPAELMFTVRVTDSAEPPAIASRELKVKTVPALQLEWQRQPVLQNDGIYGEVQVGNPSKDPYDLTFIIVAVNEIGKAFALGYQHFTLRPQARQAIAFGASLPLGSYIVHADAVGEIAAKDIIRRARLQTPKPLVKQ